MQKFYMVRHGETDWNVKFRRLQGHTDIPLNETGIRQAQALRGMLSDFSFDYVVSSDLGRAMETAKIITGGQTPHAIDPALREVKLGTGEGLTPDEVDQLLGSEFRSLWGSNLPNTQDMKFPGGESRTEVLHRIQQALKKHLLQQPGKTVLFVSHGYAIRTLVYHLTATADNFFVPNCAVVPFAFDGKDGFQYLGALNPEERLHPKVT